MNKLLRKLSKKTEIKRKKYNDKNAVSLSTPRITIWEFVIFRKYLGESASKLENGQDLLKTKC